VITYVDTSVLIKLLIDEPGSPAARQIWSAADDVVAVSLIAVEARAALAAARRARRLTPAQHRRARQHLADVTDQLNVVHVTTSLVSDAGDLAEAEGLRGYDAVHLAGALLVGATVMATADRDLARAAARQGLHVGGTAA
jgi:predicted nucleic acid-binding protein